MGGRRRIRRPPLIALVGEKLAGQQYLHPVPLRIGLALDIHGKVDGAHDPVTELLVNQLLDGGAVHADDFVPAVDEWISGHGGGDRKSTRLNSSHVRISYAVFCLKKKNKNLQTH